jgi:hypothetical protein
MGEFRYIKNIKIQNIKIGDYFRFPYPLLYCAGRGDEKKGKEEKVVQEDDGEFCGINATLNVD